MSSVTPNSNSPNPPFNAMVDSTVRAMVEREHARGFIPKAGVHIPSSIGILANESGTGNSTAIISLIRDNPIDVNSIEGVVVRLGGATMILHPREILSTQQSHTTGLSLLPINATLITCPATITPQWTRLLHSNNIRCILVEPSKNVNIVKEEMMEALYGSETRPVVFLSQASHVTDTITILTLLVKERLGINGSDLRPLTNDLQRCYPLFQRIIIDHFEGIPAFSAGVDRAMAGFLWVVSDSPVNRTVSQSIRWISPLALSDQNLTLSMHIVLIPYMGQRREIVKETQIGSFSPHSLDKMLFKSIRNGNSIYKTYTDLCALYGAPVKPLGKEAVLDKITDPSLRSRVHDTLENVNLAECPICLDRKIDSSVMVITECCGAMFCSPCFEEVFARTSKCPMCRSLLAVDSVFIAKSPADFFHVNHPKLGITPEDAVERIVHTTPDPRILLLFESVSHVGSYVKSFRKRKIRIEMVSKFPETLDRRLARFRRGDINVMVGGCDTELRGIDLSFITHIVIIGESVSSFFSSRFIARIAPPGIHPPLTAIRVHLPAMP